MTVKSQPADPNAQAMPAPFVNRFQISSVDQLVLRIAFAEAALPDNTHYRAAVTISAANAKELALTILTLVGTTSATPS